MIADGAARALLLTTGTSAPDVQGLAALENVHAGTAWEPLHRAPRVQAPDDPRFAFIAKTQEEWAEFSRVAIILARDAKTRDIFVVFGGELVKRAREDGDQSVTALVVEFDPDTDELERLAAACLALKGRHELR